MSTVVRVFCTWTVVVLLYFDVVSAVENATTYCAYVSNKVTTQTETGEPLVIVNTEQQESSSLVDTMSVVPCQADREYCFTLWYIDPADKNKHTILMQGCWDHPDTEECPEPSCIARSPLTQRNIRNNTRFCCCRGSLCNVNVTDTVNLTAIDIISKQRVAVSEYADPNYGLRTIVIALSSVGAVAISILIIFTIIRLYMCRYRSDECDETGCESSAAFLGSSESASAGSGADLDGLKIDVVISNGRYGDVYHGWLGNSEVAVKILSVAQSRCFTNEYEVLTLPMMHHPNIVELRGCRDEILPTGHRRLMIVTVFEPLGSLTDYLKNKTVDWLTACRMCHSIAAGLAHLHTEFYDGDIVKPTVAHRDVNSRNVLVKSDLSCCLCDFGFAMKLPTTRITEAGTNDDRASLADVGTLRYMAPEVLEGSVNLYDCRMALTQVDVYSLGLVFWEIGTRCHELYQGLPTPEYQLPFENEVGSHVSFEEMQVAVSRNKVRPAFPDMWKDTNLAIKALKDTIVECWDHDAEARISAVCAEERTREMASFWETRFKGLTPTVHLKDLDDKVKNKTTDYDDIISDNHEQQASSVRSSTVVDPVTLKADCNIDLERSGAMAPPLAPRNAQNPTVERNTHRSSSEELSVEGNTLVVRRAGAVTAAPPTEGSVRSSVVPSAVVANRPLSALRPDQLQRIAYVQNDVESSNSTEPKRQNVATSNAPISQVVDITKGTPQQGSHSVGHGLMARPCEVVYLEDAGTTITRPTSLPLEMSRCNNFAPSNLNMKPPNVEISMMPVDAAGSRVPAAVGGRVPGSQSAMAQQTATLSSSNVALNHTTDSMKPSTEHNKTAAAAAAAAQCDSVKVADHVKTLVNGLNGCLLNSSVPCIQSKPAADNFGFEASTSPQFDIANETSCKV